MTNIRKLLIIIFAFSLVFTSVACQQNEQTAPKDKPTEKIEKPKKDQTKNQIIIADFSFNPSELTIKKGEKVTWLNNDSTTHTVTSDTGEFDSGDLANGSKFSHTFDKTGTFKYKCTIHPDMAGTIIVE